ncbi:phage capsid protein [Sphingomonas sp. UV9]|uniref:GPO family capsid scaffolding protein n=1 Tax=Sphingomonas sp. UV9 TaxID=1851410 RepID=UPI000FFC239F|nr:GPO family capsid scaffolding protein [Sphingomonas sp. UV9]RXD05576.1 phage capsid protein [Sphingomonas sp. UV9]
MPKTKSFIVAVAGDTVDGRTIEASWLTDIAATYNRATYGARVNKEHIVGLSGGDPFKIYGDVLSVSTEEVTLQLGGKPVKKLALRAEIEASDELVAMTANGQKIYTSIEVAPNFANTGKANIVGLAVTDTPASLGTDVLSFAIKHPGALSTGPKLTAAGNVFSLGYETSFELAEGEVAAPPADSAAGMFAAITSFFSGKTAAPAVVTPPPPASEPPANDNELSAQVTKGFTDMAAAMIQLGKELRGDMGKLRTDQETLRTQVEGTPKPGQFNRQPSTGGTTGGQQRAEC